jgi:hypothetical protein
VLVVQGPSKTFNPSLSDAATAAQRAADSTAAPAERDAIFRDDLASYLTEKLLTVRVERGRPLELPPVNGIAYRAFCDASGGGSGASLDGDRIVIDLVRGVNGGNPSP